MLAWKDPVPFGFKRCLLVAWRKEFSLLHHKQGVVEKMKEVS
jgi:hypothetical protein